MQNNFNEIVKETEESMEKEEKIESINDLSVVEKIKKTLNEPISCSGAKRYFKERKMKKLIKTSLICGLASFVIAGLAVMVAANSKVTCKNLLKKNGYAEANAAHRQEVIEDLAAQLSNKEITLDQFETNVKNIQDLDKMAYAQENLDESALKKYKTVDIAGTVSAYTAGAFAGMGIVGVAISGCAKIDLGIEENKRNARDARFSRILGGR